MKTTLRHAAFWVGIYLIYSLMLSFNSNPRAILLLNLLNTFLYILAYYGLRNLQLPLLYDQGRKAGFALSLVASAIGLYALHRMGLLLLDGMYGIRSGLRYDFLADFLVKVIRFYSPAAILLAVESHLKLKRERQRIRQLEKDTLTNELNYIKAQINPQFLFSALSRIHEFVRKDSEKAPEMILRLSDILDYVLYKSQQPFVTLKDEMKAIDHFLYLERIRLGETFEVKLNSSGDTSALLSPLTLFSAVDSAFKSFGLTENETQWMDIRIDEDDQAIHCKIECRIQNRTAFKNAAENPKLEDLYRHLDLTYADQYDLVIRVEGHKSFLYLTLNHQ